MCTFLVNMFFLYYVTVWRASKNVKAIKAGGQVRKTCPEFSYSLFRAPNAWQKFNVHWIIVDCHANPCNLVLMWSVKADDNCRVPGGQWHFFFDENITSSFYLNIKIVASSDPGGNETYNNYSWLPTSYKLGPNFFSQNKNRLEFLWTRKKPTFLTTWLTEGERCCVLTISLDQ